MKLRKRYASLKVIALLLSFLMILFLAVACGGETTQPDEDTDTLQSTAVTGVILNISEYTFTDPNSSIGLSAVVSPYNAENQEVKWSSENIRIATVDENGNVTPLLNGETEITVRTVEGDFSATCKIIVNFPPPPAINTESITIDLESYAFTQKNEDLQLNITFTPENTTDKMLVWTSSAPEIVYVDEFGLCKALAEGSAEITATSVDGGFTATCKTTVKFKKASSSNNNSSSTKLPSVPSPKLSGGYLSSDNLADFNKINSEILAWLYVPGTNINFPIAQGSDNSYYLDKGLDKKNKNTGSGFIDYRSTIKESNQPFEQNTIIFGHAKGDDVFDQLENNTRTNTWFNTKSNRYVYLNTLTHKYVYEVFATYYVNSNTYYIMQNNYMMDNDTITGIINKAVENNDTNKALEYLEILDDKSRFYKTFKDSKAFLSYFNNWQKRAENFDDNGKNWYHLKDRDFGITVKDTDQIITLYTCADAGEIMKYVLHARLVQSTKR